MKVETCFQTARDGATIHTYHWSPDYEVGRGIVHIIHGLSEHAGRYERLAEELTSEGYQVFAHDQRGHGLTAGGVEDLGFVTDSKGWQHLVDDTIQLCATERKQFPQLPLYLFGHSMGTYVTQQIIYQSPALADAVILSGPNGDVGLLTQLGRLIARFERLRQGRRGRSDLINALSFGAFNREFSPNRTSYDWLSRDEEAVDSYIADPFCGFLATNQFWIDLLDAIIEIARPANRGLIRRDLPIYIFSGRNDPVNKQGRGAEHLAEFYRAMGIRNVSYRIYPKARHETLNELNRDEVIDHIIEWLDCLRAYQRATDNHRADGSHLG
jgi:alpha-beta hydrolase superfamily lysophospholipase